METKNKLTVARGWGDGDHRVKKGEGQVKEHEYRTHGHGQCGGFAVVVGGTGQGRATA